MVKKVEPVLERFCIETSNKLTKRMFRQLKVISQIREIGFDKPTPILALLIDMDEKYKLYEYNTKLRNMLYMRAVDEEITNDLEVLYEQLKNA